MTVALPQDTDVRHGDRRAAAQVGEWFRTWQATGDPAIRERIILAHLGMAERLATRFRHTRDVGHDDLVQAARVGLVAAVDRFEPNGGNSFIGYAVVCITGELRRCLRDTCWQVHVPRTLKERALQVVRARDALTVMLERSPTLAEIAGRLAITEEHVAGALEAIGTRCRWSLDEPIGVDGTTSLGALLPAPTGEIQLEDRLALPGLLAGLPELERRAVLLRFYGDFKQHEIGAMLGLLPDARLAAAAKHPAPHAQAALLLIASLPADEQHARRREGGMGQGSRTTPSVVAVTDAEDNQPAVDPARRSRSRSSWTSTPMAPQPLHPRPGNRRAAAGHDRPRTATLTGLRRR
jgi:RNA polymerase sigma-B factor